MDQKSKKSVFQQNKKLFEYVYIRNIKFVRPVKYIYNNFLEDKFKNTTFDKYAIVDVIFGDMLDVTKQMVDNGMNPIIVTTIDKTFDGMNIEIGANIYDDQLLLRSNYYKTLSSSDILPINDTDTIYTQLVFVARDANFNQSYNGFYTSVATSVISKQETLIEGNLGSKTFISTLQKMRTIFQLAYINGHNTVILPIVGSECNYPIENIISIYNSCILEFGHLFKFIVVTIPKILNTQGIYMYVTSNIIKPHTYVANTN